MPCESTQEAYNIILGIINSPLISTLVSVVVGAFLGYCFSSVSQRRQRRLDSLNDRFAALRKFIKVVEDIPSDVGRQELVFRLQSDKRFREELAHRLVRLFGLRNELVPLLDREVVDFIEKTFRPLFDIETGEYALSPDKVEQFGEAALELRRISSRVEKRLVAEHEKLSG